MPPPTPPLVTIGMTSYNHADYLPAAIESALAQTVRDFEIIIADDGSADNSVEIARAYADRHPDLIKVFTHADRGHCGVGATTNLTVTHARGEYLAWLDSDDLWYPDTLQRRLSFMASQPQLGLMCSFHDIIDAAGQVVQRRAGHNLTRICQCPPLFVDSLLLGCSIVSPSVMVRRQALAAIGLFDPALLYGDWEMWIRLVARFPIGFLEDAPVMYRRHRGATSGPNMPLAKDLYHRLAVMEALQRKAPAIGGVLALPQIRALISLELGHYNFCLEQRRAAAEHVQAALALDPALARPDNCLMKKWQKVRPLVAHLRQDFHAWLAAQLAQSDHTALVPA